MSALCNRGKCITSTHNAASWGYFDPISCSWNVDILSSANFPIHLLPSVVQPGTNFGTLYKTFYDIQKETIVGKYEKE